MGQGYSGVRSHAVSPHESRAQTDAFHRSAPRGKRCRCIMRLGRPRVYPLVFEKEKQYAHNRVAKDRS